VVWQATALTRLSFLESMPILLSIPTFVVASSGVTYGTINALMTIGNFRGAPFMAFAEIIDGRGINFVANAIVLAAAFLQAFSTNMSML
jgi:hypothetical protein